MAAPNKELQTLRPDLAAFVEFDLEASRRGFIGAQVFTVVEVGISADNPGRVPLAQLLGGADLAPRASGSAYPRGYTEFEDFSYATRDYGAEEPVDDRDERLYRSLLDIELIAYERAFDRVLRSHEQRVATKLADTSVWTGASLATDVQVKWIPANATTAKPISDISDAKKKIRDASGLRPNTLILPWEVYENLQFIDQVTDAITASGAGDAAKRRDITADMLRQVFDVDKVLVGDAQKNTSKSPTSASLSEIWNPELVHLCVTDDGPDIRRPCVGRTFHWGEDGSNIGGVVEEYRKESRRSNIIRVRMETDEVVMYKEAAHLLTGIT